MNGHAYEKIKIPAMVHPDNPEALSKLADHYLAKFDVLRAALVEVRGALHPRRDEYLYDLVSGALERTRYGADTE